MLLICALIPVAAWALYDRIDHYLVWVFIGFVLMVFMFLIILFLFSFTKPHLIHLCIQRLGWVSRIKFADRILNLIEDIPRNIRELHVKSNSGMLGLLTICIWAMTYGSTYMIVKSVGLQITIFDIFLITTIMIPIRLTPVQGLGNFGTHELGWGSILLLVGYSQQDTLMFAVNAHLLLFVYVFFLGGYAFFATMPWRRGASLRNISANG